MDRQNELLGKTNTSAECELLVRTSSSTANGATWHGINQDCFAEFNMTGAAVNPTSFFDERTGLQFTCLFGQGMYALEVHDVCFGRPPVWDNHD